LFLHKGTTKGENVVPLERNRKNEKVMFLQKGATKWQKCCSFGNEQQAFFLRKGTENR